MSFVLRVSLTVVTAVVKLSDTLQTYAPEKECTSNVHVSHRIGETKAPSPLSRKTNR